MTVRASIVVGQVTIEVIHGNLLEQPVEAIMLSANNKLNGQSSWSKDIRPLAGSAYDLECAEVAKSAGPDGLRQGSAVVTGGYKLARGNLRRRVIQAITVGYRRGQRIPATPDVIYHAVRAGLEKAEIYRVSSVATYLMAVRPGFGAQSPQAISEALSRAVIDHAMIASSVSRFVIAEDPTRVPGLDTLQLAVDALNAANRLRHPD